MNSNSSLMTSLSLTSSLSGVLTTSHLYSTASSSDAGITVFPQPVGTCHPNDAGVSQGNRQSNFIDSADITMPWFTDDDISTSIKGKPASEDTGGKTPRLRTVLNEYQLRVLRTCYAVTSRPDQATKNKLEEMTGLNSRVIRVWFQNKRCKDKKRPSAFFLRR